MERPKYKISVTHGEEYLGEMLIETFPDIAPLHSANFEELVAETFFDGTAFHRVIPGFMIQGGDPNSKNKPRDTWGFGDPKQKKVKAEFSKTEHKRGIISAARSQNPDSASSQFFICVANASYLNGQYSVFGQVLEGMEIADKIVAVRRDKNDNPHEKVEMKIEKVSE